MGDRPAIIFALQRRNIGNRRGQHRAEAFQPLKVLREAVGHRERHDRDQPRHLQIAFVLKLPTRRLVDRLEIAFVPIALTVRRDAHHAVEDAHELLSLPELVLDIFPLARLVADLRSKLRALRRSEEHTSELQSLMRSSYAVICLKKTKYNDISV